jgi:hypothetical protein
MTLDPGALGIIAGIAIAVGAWVYDRLAGSRTAIHVEGRVLEETLREEASSLRRQLADCRERLAETGR